MNHKVKDLITTYDNEMFKLGINVKKCEDYCGQVGAIGLEDDDVKLGHLRWMIQKMQDEGGEWSERKTNRWLGFIQGTLWSTKLRGIVELRDESRNLYDD